MYSKKSYVISIIFCLLIMVKSIGFANSYNYGQAEPVIVKGMVSENGVALQGVRLTLGAGNIVFTDFLGNYEGTVYAKQFVLYAKTKTGKFIGQKEVTVADGENTVTIDFDVASALISGTITENGMPLANARVFIGKNSSITTDNNGHYQSHVALGEDIRIMATTQAGEFIDQKMVDITNSDEQQIDFSYVPGLVTVNVTKDNTPVSGVRVVLDRNNLVKTDSNGTAAQKVVPGTVNVFISNDKGKVICNKQLTVAANETVNLNVTL